MSIVKKVCNFSLPLPGENTMVSIRIDTGYEKVDTDYVPLEDIEMIINQEFCLYVFISFTLASPYIAKCFLF